MVIKTFFDFCSGIGGGRLGLENCELKSVGYADTSRLAVETYCLLFDELKGNNFGNLRKLNSEILPEFDFLIAGLPCQSFSIIGNQKGLDDPRGQLIFQIKRIIHEKQPKVFLLENVKGLVTHAKGETFKTIIGNLNSLNYRIIYKVLNSLDYGVPQMRQRVYIIGIRNDLPTKKEFNWPKPIERVKIENFLKSEDNQITHDNMERLKRYLLNDTNLGRHKITDFLEEDYLVIDTRMSDLRLYRQRVPALRSHRDGIFYIKDKSIRELTGYEALLLQGFPQKYALKVKDKVSDRHLLKQAGNAMTINVIELITKSILDYLNT